MMREGREKNFRRHACVLVTAALLTVAGAGFARAEDYVLSLKDHQFSPQYLSVRAYVKVTITVKNLDITSAEVGSAALKMDPVLLDPNGQIEFTVGPLNPGTYDLFDAFHNDTECELTVR